MDTLSTRQAVFSGVLLLANRMQTRYDALPGDLTLKQWLALIVVHSMPQPVPSTAVIADALGTSHQNVSKLVAALAERQFVNLEPSVVDGRARQVRLAPAGLAYLGEHAKLGERLLDELFADVDRDDLASCLRVLDAMSRSLTGEGLVPTELQA